MKKYKENNEKIQFFTRLKINTLVYKIATINNPAEIYFFTSKTKNLTKENIDVLTKCIAKTQYAYYIYLFAKDVKNLPKENIDLLTKAIVETKDAGYIYDFAINVKNLTKENIDLLTKAIVETKNAKYIYYFNRDVKNLSNENLEYLLNIIIEHNDIPSFKDMLHYFYEDKVVLKAIENVVFNSRNKHFIAIYLYFSKDNKLINKIFKTKDIFLQYLYTYQKELDIKEEDINTFKLINKFDFVDDNINNYLQEEPSLKKQ